MRRGSGERGRQAEAISHQPSAVRLRARLSDARRRGFSLAEMMIAIVILGLGMLMAATMFPVGWLRARDLADFTNSTAATTTAATTVQLLCRAADDTASSFLGDVADVVAGLEPVPRVHALHLENALASPPGGNFTLVGDFLDAEDALISIELRPPGSFPVPQISFHERVFPSLAPRPDPMTDPLKAAQWEAQLRNRRFAWGILHRFDTTPLLGEARSMTIYLVTLRRTQATHRFARQNPAASTDRPTALPAEEDVLFPVPWLVELTIAGSWRADGTYQDPVGVPSEATAKPGSGDGGRLIAQMLMSGSVLIDRIQGHVYTVRQHRFTGANEKYDYQASLTLDREITEVDLGLAVGTPVQVDVYDDGTPPNLGGNVRDFWVFPPPVARGDGVNEAFPLFDGLQPVVSIEMRQMVFSP